MQRYTGHVNILYLFHAPTRSFINMKNIQSVMKVITHQRNSQTPNVRAHVIALPRSTGVYPLGLYKKK